LDRVLSFEPANPDHARNFGVGGTLQGWKDGVATHACHSTRLIDFLSTRRCTPQVYGC
jgi:hypothetical protein